MPARLLFDTDVVIDYLRGEDNAIACLESRTDSLSLSVIAVAELYAGVRQGKEREALAAFIQAFTVVPIDRAVAELGGLFRRDYGKSHGTGLADALIAATAVRLKATLVTLNSKPFPMLEKVLVPYKK